MIFFIYGILVLVAIHIVAMLRIGLRPMPGPSIFSGGPDCGVTTDRLPLDGGERVTEKAPAAEPSTRDEK